MIQTSESIVDKGFTWAYCYLCVGLELVCPKCKKSSCCGSSCDFCHETFVEFNKDVRKFTAAHVDEIPDSIPVIGMAMHKLMKEWEKEND